LEPIRYGVLAQRAGMRRREFIGFVGGAAAWPVMARAQQPERMRRVGVLMTLSENDPEGQLRISAFAQRLAELGWTVGRNLQIDYRWGTGDADQYRKYVLELMALSPDAVLAGNGPITAAFQRASRTVPIVFVSTIDPVASGIVASLARPGGNATGFTTFEFGVSAKWLELLKQTVPSVTRAAVIRDPTTPAGAGQFGAIQAVAPSLGIEVSPIDVRDAGEIERGIVAFSQGANSGLVVLSTALAIIHRELIVRLTARHRLPSVYPFRFYVSGGGLISYGPDQVDPFHRAADYVDRILKGEKAADLPVQAPTRPC
jgi:putative ABC transport system substrate-binding protein